MASIWHLHDQAVKLIREALSLESANGDPEKISELKTRAFENGLIVAEYAGKINFEPTRSLLLRSSAEIARKNGKYEDAEELINQALAGSPPQGIKSQLDKMLEMIKADRTKR